MYKYRIEIHGFSLVCADSEDEAISLAQDGQTTYEELEFGPAVVLESEEYDA